LIAAAGGAQAQTAPLKVAPDAARVSAPLDMSRLRSALDLTPEQAEALRVGIARTSVDHRFVDKLSGSLGFLCGLHGQDYDEGASMRGADPAGKFLGAKLSLAFR
jgi:hypothetical protein